MHHPGPPRFVAVGDEVELAPRDPDPAATYGWRVVEAPSSSTAAVGDDPVERLLPDAPGRYVVELTAPDGTHRQTVRAFPGHLASRPADETFASSGGVGGDGEPGILDAAGESVSGRGDPDDGDGGGRPRVRLDATVEEGAVVVRATTRPHPDSAERPVDLDVEFLLDDRDGVERGDVTVERGRLRVPTDVLSDRLRVYGVAVGTDGYSVPDAVSITRGDGDGGGGTTARITTDRPYEPPAWAGDGVIYEVYVRTFPGEDHDDGDGRSVFDVIRDRLDYIEGLGVDALWLSPVLQNDDFRHGYNVTDFFSIAADLGTREGYERLIEAAHDRGMRVLFDLVCNHTARDHPYFRAAVSDPDSDYREWYEWRGPDEPETYFDWPYIANLNFDHLPVRRHLLDAVDEWAPLVDGFRCDMAWAVPEGFWREIRDRTKAEAEEFLLLDETIPYVADFHGALFDVHFDPTVYDALRRVGAGRPPRRT